TDKSAISESKEYFNLLNKRIRAALDEGVDASEITNLIKMEEFKNKAMYDILNQTNVSKAFYELEFEE
ncbi:MAG: MBL fold metallo-hydrolase, partial [Epsilonproteobacteria bacterium]